MARVDNLENFLTDVAGAIREKKGTQDQIPAENFDTEIKSITSGLDTSDATATADDIINPKTAYVNGQKLSGSIMPEYSPVKDLVITDISTDYDASNSQGASNEDGYIAIKNGTNLYLYKDNALLTVFTELPSALRSMSLSKAYVDGNKIEMVLIYASANENNAIPTMYHYALCYDGTNWSKTTLTASLDVANNGGFSNRGWGLVLKMAYNSTTNTQYVFVFAGGNDSQLKVFKVEYTPFINSTTLTITNMGYNYMYGGSVGSREAIQLDAFYLSDSNNFIVNYIDKHFKGMLIFDSVPSSTSYNSNYSNAYDGSYVNSRYLISPTRYIQTTYSNGVITLSLYSTNNTLLSSTTYNLTCSEIVPAINNVGYFQLICQYKNLLTTIYFNTADDTLQLVRTLSSSYISLIRMGAILYASDYNARFVCSTQKLTTVQPSGEYIVTGFTRNQMRYQHLDNEVNTDTSYVLSSKKYYNKNGLQIGTMPNNGELIYNGSDEIQTIPAGYTSGGRVNPMDATTSTVYKQAIAILKDIKPTVSATYKQIDYIGGTGSQRLYTDIPTDSATDTYEITLRDTDVTNWEYYFQLGVMRLARYQTRPTEFCFYAGTNRAGESFTLGNINDGNWHTIKITPNALSFDSSRKISYSVGGTSTGAINIFYPGDTTSSFLVKEFKMYRAGELISHLIPCKNIQTNIVGMYDLIGNKFYDNTGSGTFTSGDIIGDIDVEDYTLEQRLLDLQDYINQNIVPANIRADKTIFDVTGTAPVTFSTIEEMNEHTNLVEDTFAIVYGTSYVGTYRLNNGAWTQIGNSTEE